MVRFLLIAAAGCGTGLERLDGDEIPGPLDTASEAVIGEGEDAVPSCEGAPLPAVFTSTSGWGGAPHFDLDPDGYHVSVRWSDLLGRHPTEPNKLIASSVGLSLDALRLLPNGDVMVIDHLLESLVRVSGETGRSSTIQDFMRGPSGIEVLSDGRILVSERGAGRIRAVDSANGSIQTLTGGLDKPTSLVASPDEQTLYVASASGPLLALPTDGTGASVLYEATEPIGALQVDGCGSVYATEGDRLLRIDPDTGAAEVVAVLPEPPLTELRWGNGSAGWQTDVLYVSADGGVLHAVEVGIEGKAPVAW